MSVRTFQCICQKCGADFEFVGSYEKFNEFMDSEGYSCSGGHTEGRAPRIFLKVRSFSEPKPIVEWEPVKGKKYVDVLDPQTVRIKNMQIDHLGSGLYVDRRSGKKYDYEEDAKGHRHYYEIPA